MNNEQWIIILLLLVLNLMYTNNINAT